MSNSLQLQYPIRETGFPVIDKLDVRIPRHTDFSPAFKRLYGELQDLERRPFRPSKYYEFSGDLREYGLSVRLNLFCQMDKIGNHKIELIDVGQMSRTQIICEIQQIFDVDALALSNIRVDFAVDVPGLPVQWFRETLRIEHKRFRAAVTGQPFYSEMGKGEIQTLYFGKRPNVIRIYDKTAEYQHQYRELVRKLGKDVEPPTFESVFNGSSSDSVLTRVERQIGGRIPTEIGTLQKIVEPGFEFNPFTRLKIIDHQPAADLDSNLSFETLCTGLYLRSLRQNDGMQATSAFITKYSKGNARWVRTKYETFLAAPANDAGLTESALLDRFRESMTRQMST